MSSKRPKLSEAEVRTTSVLEKPDLRITSGIGNRTWFFYFHKLVAVDITDEVFYDLCVWKDELAFSENCSLPTEIRPLNSQFTINEAKEVQREFLTQTAHEVLLKEVNHV